MHWFQFEVIVLVLMFFACIFAAGTMVFDAVRDLRRARKLLEQQEKRREPGN